MDALRERLTMDRLRSSLPEGVESYVSTYVDTVQKVVCHLVIGKAVFDLLFLFNAFLTYSFPNMGFNTILVAMLSCIQSAVLWAVFNPNNNGNSSFAKTAFNLGLIIGGTIGMAVMTLMVSIYFGRLSHCESASYSIHQYFCGKKGAMWFVWLFSGLLFWINLILAAIMTSGKDELTDGNSQYQDISVNVVDDYDRPPSVSTQSTDSFGAGDFPPSSNQGGHSASGSSPFLQV